MQLSTFTIILASLASSIAALPLSSGSEVDVLTVRDTAIHVSEPVKRAIKPRASSSGGSGATPPAAPGHIDRSKLQVWLRVDEKPMALREPTEPHHHAHDKLKRLTTDQGGQHTDVLVGNPSTGWTAYGIEFSHRDWVKNHNNGDGAEVNVYAEEAEAVDGGPVRWTFRGTVKDGRIRSGDSASLKSKAQRLAAGKVYSVSSFNCGSFAQEFINEIV
ncbi:hypothetical protein MAPG_05062 [Magnaporthiopsis poae ATCC 64411]|uniref:Uncharacterized protein n=1 Tax=Magnaporthiopsis poae (strain ATCC 64411 / 73-15) TaxID=644358 RepID=A0A0C4DYE1_MAGP6|nr:hypothetical protein MAPG_05062 [Magnaporthiopsis poae ATCC 64411]